MNDQNKGSEQANMFGRLTIRAANRQICLVGSYEGPCVDPILFCHKHLFSIPTDMNPPSF